LGTTVSAIIYLLGGTTSCGRGIVGRAITSIPKANWIVAETTAADKLISISSSPLIDWLWFL
jgi:hypothetical protein